MGAGRGTDDDRAVWVAVEVGDEHFGALVKREVRAVTGTAVRLGHADPARGGGAAVVHRVVRHADLVTTDVVDLEEDVNTADNRRKLTEVESDTMEQHAVSEIEAKEACRNNKLLDYCIHDVLAFDDLETAEDPFYQK